LLFLLLIFVITFAAFTVLLWAGTVFFQGYIYTEPSQEVYWQAPAAAGALALFLTLWCLLIVNTEPDNNTDIHYNTIFNFSPRADKYKEPVEKIVVKRKGEPKPIKIEREKTPQGYRYKGFPPAGVISFETITKDEKMTFVPGAKSEGNGYDEFVSDGWFMKVYESGPTGIPEAFFMGRFFLSLFLNFFHLALWFVCLWLILRFQWAHALGFGFVMWLIMTLVILPMLLEQAAIVAQKATPAPKQGRLLSPWNIGSAKPPSERRDAWRLDTMKKSVMLMPKCA
jgi:hypothetical protein